MSFLCWHRDREYDAKAQVWSYRGTRAASQGKTLVVACRYWYELTDGFWGQLVLTQVPHLQPASLLPQGRQHLQCMQNFAGMLHYLSTWVWKAPGVIEAAAGSVFYSSALPRIVQEGGEVREVGVYHEGARVFLTDEAAFLYMRTLAYRDLQYRGFRDETLATFEFKQDANFLLYQRVLMCQDAHEYDMLRQSWDVANRPKYAKKVWRPANRRCWIGLTLRYPSTTKRRSRSRIDGCTSRFEDGVT